METWKEFDHNVITHSAAHHLMAVDDLVQRLGYARVSDVARQLSITRGSVSMSLRPLKEAGLIEQDQNKHLRLSESGKALVDAIKTKRHLVRRFFVEVLGVPADQSEIDACKLEHLLSNETARRLLSLLKFFDADDPSGKSLIAAWRKFDPTCAHDPDECPSCEDECLADAVTPVESPEE